MHSASRLSKRRSSDAEPVGTTRSDSDARTAAAAMGSTAAAGRSIQSWRVRSDARWILAGTIFLATRTTECTLILHANRPRLHPRTNIPPSKTFLLPRRRNPTTTSRRAGRNKIIMALSNRRKVTRRPSRILDTQGQVNTADMRSRAGIRPRAQHPVVLTIQPGKHKHRRREGGLALCMVLNREEHTRRPPQRSRSILPAPC